MIGYKAPVRDMRFLLHEVFTVESAYQEMGYTEASRDMVDAVLEEGAKFNENVLAPLYQSGDEEGAKFDKGKVTTAKGFKEAYQQYCEGGWGGISADPEYGGQGLPHSLEIAIAEMFVGANVAWRLCSQLSLSAVNALGAHATAELKQLYLPKLISGQWPGTMCLTEPHCGTDLGIMRTKAEPNADGSYAISGTKIFITYGEHDMAENIVHLVLAKLPDAPAGSKGISLFLVPKFLPTAQGAVGEPNAVACGSIEKKMGIKASPTCVMNFDRAKGWIIGTAHNGLACMFAMMNHARIDVGLQGVGLGERSFQNALHYATERLQMRALTGAKYPDKPADPIIVHPDVRRMLLTQKALVEGCRALALFTGTQVDKAKHHPDTAVKREAEEVLAFLTPIVKAFSTYIGLEATNLGMQVLGGHGYIHEWGMEQMVRDVRISLIYEGTNGIQALDLLRRKILGTQGEALKLFLKHVDKFCEEQKNNAQLNTYVSALSGLKNEWLALTQQIAQKAKQNPNEIGAASDDYLVYSGYIILAYFWALMAKTAQEQLQQNTADKDFYTAKIHVANFYYQKLLPRTQALSKSIQAGAAPLMDIPDELFMCQV